MRQLTKEVFVGFLLGTGVTSFFHGEILYSSIVFVLGVMALCSMIYYGEGWDKA